MALVGSADEIAATRSAALTANVVDAFWSKAVAIWSCDSAISADALGEVRGVGGVSRALAVSL